jgi:hypothetical protein
MMESVGFSGGMFAGGLIWMVIMAALLVIPFWKILPRSGIPSWVAVFAFIPIVGLILLWVVAFKSPDENNGGNS